MSYHHEALLEAKVPNRLHMTHDGMAVLQFLRKEQLYNESPSPGSGALGSQPAGIGGLGANQARSGAQNHPVIILTSSYAEGDVLKSYDNHANAYVTKPVDLEKYFTMSRPPR
jgi:CheY-like chemotaxis protein